MTGTIIFLALGAILLGILLAIVLFVDQPGKSPGTDGKQGMASPAILEELELNSPSRLLADRIFAQSDLDFVARDAPSLERSFVRERKKLALLWLADARFSMGRIFRFYRTAVRSNPDLEFRTELRIAGNYLLLLCMISFLQVLINLLGPFQVRGILVHMFVLADRISTGVGKTLAVLDRSSLVRIKDDWARQAGVAD